MTNADVILWMNIRKRACIAAKLIIEGDGATQATPEELAYDARRTKYPGQQGWTVLRVNNSDVYEYMDGMWRSIAARLAPPARFARDLPTRGED